MEKCLQFRHEKLAMTYICNGNQDLEFLHVGAVLLDSAFVTALCHGRDI
jgi:hypothetical protein